MAAATKFVFARGSGEKLGFDRKAASLLREYYWGMIATSSAVSCRE